MSEQNENKAGCIGLVASFFFPIIGVIIYFVNKDKVSDASSYLYSALGGFAVSFIGGIIMGLASGAH